LTYEKAVLTALQDVENALVAYAREQERRVALADAVTANRQAVDLSMTLYTQGQIEFLDLLVAQQALYASQSAFVQSDVNVSTDLVALYKALGGGWEILAPGTARVPTTMPAWRPVQVWLTGDPPGRAKAAATQATGT
jgi:outer membrane protein TolC